MDLLDEQIRRQQIDYTKEFLSIVFSMDVTSALDFYEQHIHDISALLHDRFKDNPEALFGDSYGLYFHAAIREFDIRDAHEWFRCQPKAIVRFIRDYYAQVGQNALSSDPDYGRKTREKFPEMQDILEDIVATHGQEEASILLYSLLNDEDK